MMGQVNATTLNSKMDTYPVHMHAPLNAKVQQIPQSCRRGMALGLDGIYALDEMAPILGVPSAKVKAMAYELATNGEKIWESLGVGWAGIWIVDMPIFIPFFNLHLLNHFHVVKGHWTANQLVIQKGFFYLADVCDRLPFSVAQMRYRCNNGNGEGLFKQNGTYVVDMKTFGPWASNIWQNVTGRCGSVTFEADESRMMKPHPSWDKPSLLSQKGIFYLKDLLEPLGLEMRFLKRMLQGSDLYQKMGVGKLWTKYIVRMTVFAPWYQDYTPLPSVRVEQVPTGWDAKMLIHKGKGIYSLVQVCRLLPLSPRQLRYRVNTRQEDIGVWFDKGMAMYLVNMAVFRLWIGPLLAGSDQDLDQSFPRRNSDDRP